VFDQDDGERSLAQAQRLFILVDRNVALIFHGPGFVLGYQPCYEVGSWKNGPGQDAKALVHAIGLVQKDVKAETLGVRKEAHSLPKGSGIIAMMTNTVPEVCMR
jgi:hypothetical protein